MAIDGLLLAGIYSVLVLVVVIILNLPSYYPENLKLVMLMIIVVIMLASTGMVVFSKRR